MLPNRTVLKRLWAYLRPYWHFEVATFAIMMVLAALALALPAAVQYMIDGLIPNLVETAGHGIDWTPALYFGLILIGIYFLRVVFSLAQDYLATLIGASIINDIRSELFAHLETISFRFYQRHQMGEIISRVLSDVSRIQNLLAVTVLSFLQSVLLLLGILIYLLYVDWKLTLVALAPVPLTIIFSNYFGVKAHGIVKSLQEVIASFQGRLQESLGGLRTVRAFGQERAETEKIVGILERLKSLFMKNAIVSSLSFNFVYFLNMLGPVIVLAWGTYLIATGEMKLGALMAFYMLLAYLYGPVQDLASINVNVQAAMASVNRVFEYLDLPPAIEQAAQPVVLNEARGALVLDNVSYHHEDSDFAIENLSLDIKPGETVAIVGPSGAGKTTVINLIMRFFDPDSGSVSLDGVDLKQIELKSLRSCMSLVDQDPLLFKMSIRENIAYADPGASMDVVERAARIANIHDFITNQKNGYDTEVGERGVTVSGGERQRLCLARAVLNDPPVILLDEATSSLDTKSEELIQQALSELLKEKTAIIVAHRLATVRHADRIVVMEKGRIVDQGTHDGLLKSSALYRELANKQLML